MDVELKGCPWCGEAPQISERCYQGSYPIWTIQCVTRECPAQRVMVEDNTKSEAIAAWNQRHSGGDGEDAARFRHLLDRHLSLTPVEGGGWDVAEYSEHGIETVLFGHADARVAIDRVMQYHGQTEDAARAGERG